jgi:ribonuclease BN (tRNA processing enzyme)
MEIRLLGSGGWLPTDRRETACIYLRKGAEVLLLDAGTGLRRLVTDRGLLDGVDRLFVALTHFHLDHTAGLVGLPALRDIPVREVWAPGRLVAGLPASELVHRLLGPPFLAAAPGDVMSSWLTGVHELDRHSEIGQFHLETRVQPLHTGSTLAFKVDDWLAYCTDTAYDVENAGFVRGARVLLHEAMHAADRTDDPIHSAAGEAARIAAEAKVERLILVHVNPTNSSDDELLGFARTWFADSTVATDGLTF